MRLSKILTPELVRDYAANDSLALKQVALNDLLAELGVRLMEGNSLCKDETRKGMINILKIAQKFSKE